MRLSPLDLLKWIHFLFLGTALGAGVVALLLSGFEQERKDLEGLAATVWKKAVVWPLRLAVLVGILALVQKFQGHWDLIRTTYYLHIKLSLVLPLLASAEMAPKMLATGRRGAAMVTMLLLLLISGIVYNQRIFVSRATPAPANLPNAAEMAPAK